MNNLIRKFAEDLSSTIAVPIEAPPNTPAPTSKGPHNNKQLPQQVQNHSRVNTAIPSVNAGADEQKALPPMKVAHVSIEGAKMATFGARPLIQDLVKQAMTNAVDRARLSSEHAHLQKIASSGESAFSYEDNGKKKEAQASGDSVPTEYAMKLAAAVEYLVKQAADVGPGAGPNALPVSSPKDHPAVLQPGQSGHSAQHSVPMSTPEQKGLSTEQGATQMQNTLDEAPGGGGEQQLSISGGKGKTAAPRPGKGFDRVKELFTGSHAAKLEKAVADKKIVARKSPWDPGGVAKEKAKVLGTRAAAGATAVGATALGVKALKDKDPGQNKTSSIRERLMKVAEDAINPAHISAGAAVPPDTSAAGESGGQPVGGSPQGPTGLVASNEAAINYNKGQAYAGRKTDLAAYLNERALSSATDPVLNKAFEHTSQAGVKISQALETPVQVAAARALLTKIAEEAKKEEKKDDKKDKKESKEKDSGLYCLGARHGKIEQ